VRTDKRTTFVSSQTATAEGAGLGHCAASLNSKAPATISGTAAKHHGRGNTHHDDAKRKVARLIYD
jgi:hypothetical protein